MLKELPVRIDGWKQFRRLAKNDKKLKRMINQAKLKSYRRDPFWKFGVLFPRTHAQAVELDKQNGNTKWQDAEGIEMGQLLDTTHGLTRVLEEYHPMGTKNSNAT
jgi:hypothetical protein